MYQHQAVEACVFLIAQEQHQTCTSHLRYILWLLFMEFFVLSGQCWLYFGEMVEALDGACWKFTWQGSHCTSEFEMHTAELCCPCQFLFHLPSIFGLLSLLLLARVRLLVCQILGHAAGDVLSTVWVHSAAECAEHPWLWAAEARPHRRPTSLCVCLSSFPQS